MDDVRRRDEPIAQPEPEDVMTSADTYIERVLSYMPATTPTRAQIATELRGHIAERLASGVPIDAVLDQLGDPLTLAESYLKSVPLVSASFLRRAAAKLLDTLLLVAVGGAWFWLLWRIVGPNGIWVFPALARATAPLFVLVVPVFVLIVPGYFVAAEYLTGRTFGKWLLGLAVVRESGARISLGQSCMRQLGLMGQVFWIDALFALFSEKNQRAFEIISKTRVVRAAQTANAAL
jgi:uncharacterized RDD family membrane protein YckC